MTTTKHFRIENRESGADLGIYQGSDEDDALDAMARDAGYDEYDHLLANVPGSSRDELVVNEVPRWVVVRMSTKLND